MSQQERSIIRALELITDQVAGSGDLDATLAGFASVFSEIVGAQRWSVMLKTDHRNLRIRASQGVPAEVVANVVVRVGEGIAGGVAASGSGGLLHDVLREADSSGGNYRSRSAICVPIRLRGEVLGVINLNEKIDSDGGVQEFNEGDLSLALIVANQAALAIESARAVSTARDVERLRQATDELEAKVSDLSVRADAFALIQQVTETMVTVGELDEVLGGVLTGVTRLLGASRGSVMLLDPDGQVMRIQASIGIPDDVVESVQVLLGQGISGTVAETGDPLLMSNAARSREQKPGSAEEARSYRHPGAICVPLRLNERILGVVNVNDRLDGSDFTNDDLYVAQVIANQAAIAISQARLTQALVDAARRERDLMIARDIQQAFIPAPPTIKGAIVDGCSDPCDETGGDYIDYVNDLSDEGGAAFLVCGDVSGHGIGAALIMATGRAFLRALLWRREPLSQVLYRLNNLVENDTRDDQFMTLFLGRLDRDSSRFEFASAGHELAWIYRPSHGEFIEMRATGLALGMFPDMEYEAESVAVRPGDLLLITTDGLSEASNAEGEFFGYDRIKELLASSADQSPAEIIQRFRDTIQDFIHPNSMHDDLSLVVSKLL